MAQAIPNGRYLSQSALDRIRRNRRLQRGFGWPVTVFFALSVILALTDKEGTLRDGLSVYAVLLLPGLYLLCVRGGLSGFGTGEAITLAAAILTAGALVFSKNYLEMVDPGSMTTLQAACSAALALSGSLMFEGGIHLERTTGIAWLIILYLAITCTFLGYLMQNLALTKISDRSVALIQTLCPVMTALFAFLLLGERLSTAGLTGAAIIVICVAAGAVLGENDGSKDENPVK